MAAGDKPALQSLAREREPATRAEQGALVLFVVGIAAVFLFFQLIGRGSLPLVEDDCGATASAGSVQGAEPGAAADQTGSAAACADEGGGGESDCGPSSLWASGQAATEPEPLSAAPPDC